MGLRATMRGRGDGILGHDGDSHGRFRPDGGDLPHHAGGLAAFGRGGRSGAYEQVQAAVAFGAVLYIGHARHAAYAAAVLFLFLFHLSFFRLFFFRLYFFLHSFFPIFISVIFLYFCRYPFSVIVFLYLLFLCAKETTELVVNILTPRTAAEKEYTIMPKKEKKEKKISAKNIAAENNNKKDDEALKCAIQNETKHLFYIKMTDAFFEALAHQQLPMQKAINEPVDNAIANCDDETATILAAINNANLANQFRFTIADWGNGMDENELVNGMQICGGHDKEGYLCVHGLGLKNFLLVATRNKYDWMVASKKPGEKVYHVVEGPFSTTMEMKESKEVPLKEIVMTDTLKRYGEPSTIVSVVVDALCLRLAEAATPIV